MNRWLAIRRVRGPAFLILFGITALLHQERILSFGRSWPLYLILAGILMLAERVAMKEPLPSVNVTSIVPLSTVDETASAPAAQTGSGEGKWGA